jgi:hypothetical protein
MKTYAKNKVNINEITPENKLEDYFYYLARKVGSAANKSKSAKNLFTLFISHFVY